jgi:hypothetical protein
LNSELRLHQQPDLGILDTVSARSHNALPHADVAELADAQVSEACDGDIVEVQVLSSAPGIQVMAGPIAISEMGSRSIETRHYFLEPSLIQRV